MVIYDDVMYIYIYIERERERERERARERERFFFCSLINNSQLIADLHPEKSMVRVKYVDENRVN